MLVKVQPRTQGDVLYFQRHLVVAQMPGCSVDIWMDWPEMKKMTITKQLEASVSSSAEVLSLYLRPVGLVGRSTTHDQSCPGKVSQSGSTPMHWKL